MDSSDKWKEYYKLNSNEKPFVPESFIARCFLSRRPISLLEDYHFDKKKILDVGCGDGRHIDFFDKLGFQVTGVEVGIEKVSQLREKFKKIQFYEGTSSRLPFVKNTFDYVVAVNSIYYLEENDTIENNILSCANVLNIGGVFVASFVGYKHFILANCTNSGQNNYVNNHFHQCKSDINIRVIFSKEELTNLIECGGLLKVKMVGELQDELLGSNRHLYYVIARKTSNSL